GGGDVGVLPDRHGRDQCRVAADEGAGADLRARLAAAVVIDGHDARTEVGALPDLGVANVREVRHRDPVADDGVLQRDKVAHLDLAAQPAAGPEVGEGTDARLVADLGLHDERRLYGDTVAEESIDDARAGAELAAGADPGAALQEGHRVDHRVG